MIAAHWYEDFEVGARFVTETRTVTDQDIGAFADVSGDRNPLHLDEAYAAERGYGGKIAHGVLGLAVATGLANQAGLTRGTLLAFLGLDWNFRRPLRPGDTVRLQIEIASKRETSRPDRGLVRLAMALVNEAGERIQDGNWTILVARRPG